MSDAVRQVDVEERRARLALRHRLAPSARAATPTEVATSVVALHGTDPASVHLAAAARLQEPDVAAVERALYDERALVRILGMRRTMFVLPVETAAVVQAACTRAIAAQERRKLVRLLEDGGVDEPAAYLERVERETLQAIASDGPVTGADLSKAVPGLRTQFAYGEGKKWAGVQTLTTRLLVLLAADGHIVRCRPRGSWISSQFQWAPISAWLGAALPSLPVEEARIELVRRWLARFGPGTVADLKWWTGWTLGDVRRALAGVETTEVELDGERGLVLADDVEPVGPAEPWAALLPALDPTVMGWAGRSWYLGEHAPLLFDRSGNAGPTVWWEGRVVGGWAQRKDGEIAFRLLEDVGADAAAAIATAAERLAATIGAVRVTPRFRTPLELELSA